MTFEEYRSFDGIGLADLVARGEASPVDLARCAIEAAERVNDACNAISYTRYEEAVAEAGRSRGEANKFGGVPFLLKDSGLASTDLPTSIGSRLFEGTTSPADSTLAARFREAGLITIARSTVPEMCMAPTTEARRNGGPTRNPFDLTRSSGGSSGGAAVAVASGVVPIAHGSDGGGSIRIPASCCGVFGLKPTRGRVPMGPFRGEGWGGLAADGVLTRTVRDTARALDLIGGMEPGAPYAAPSGGAFEARLEQPFDRPLRIAVWRDPWGGPVDRACLDALRHTGALCESLGHEVVGVDPPDFDYPGFIDAIVAVMASNVALSVGKKLANERREPSADDLEPAILDAYDIGVAMKATEYAEAINVLHATGRMMSRLIGDYDLVMTPTLASRPIELGALSMNRPDFRAFRGQVGALTPFLAVVNASGQPAASLPMWRDGDLPIGVQAIGPFGGEDIVLRLAAQLEKTDLWKQAARWPTIISP
jgi:amidase